MSKEITLFLLTRDFRTTDALTLYQAYEESKKSGTRLSVAFRFDPHQIDEKKNDYYSAHAVQFMIESLEILKKSLPFEYIKPVSNEEWLKYLSSIPIHQLFIARDFSPYARERVKMLSQVADVVEVDDITVFPIDKMKPYSKLAPFIDFMEGFSFPNVINKKVNWKAELDPLPKSSLISNKVPISYPNNPLMVHPDQLNDLVKDLGKNIKGYSEKNKREQVGDPKVSYLSAFIKFGLLSIRQVHHYASQAKEPSKSDIKAFHRELYFRDFYYTLAWNKPEEVFDKPNWQGKTPKFISKDDLLMWKKENGKEAKISNEEIKEIEKTKEVFEKWVKGETEYPLINAGMHQLVETGYMLNRLRMLTTSYLTQDYGLWWKYPEQIFANYLTDYDWTINAMNHQNIAKVGLYPKYTLNFSIDRQEKMNPKDKQIYIQEYQGQQ
jgi:deoxyribodipyrimidine photolyase